MNSVVTLVLTWVVYHPVRKCYILAVTWAVDTHARSSGFGHIYQTNPYVTTITCDAALSTLLMWYILV